MKCHHAFHTPDAPVRVEDLAYPALRQGLTNQEVVDLVTARLPLARTSTKSVQWYRNQLRKNEPDVPTEREAKALRSRLTGA